jgi:hypothetical protein
MMYPSDTTLLMSFLDCDGNKYIFRHLSSMAQLHVLAFSLIDAQEFLTGLSAAQQQGSPTGNANSCSDGKKHVHRFSALARDTL